MSEISIQDLFYKKKIKEAKLLGVNKLYEVISEMRQNAEEFDKELANELSTVMANWNEFKKECNLKLITPDKIESGKATFFHNSQYWVDKYYETLQFRNSSDDDKFASSIAIIDEKGFKLQPEALVNDGEFFDVFFLKELMSCCNSICRINISGKKLGTGFLLKNGYLITNNHVIQNIETAKNAVFEFSFEIKPSHTIIKSTNYSIKDKSIFLTSSFDKLDFTIVQLQDLDNNKEIPLNHWGYLEIESKINYKEKDKVYIIQHPRGRVKQVILTGNYITSTKIKDRLKYSANTEPGSSGSPVLNKDLKVIALHHAFDGDDSNRGVKFESILAYLKDDSGVVGKDIYNEIIPSKLETISKSYDNDVGDTIIGKLKKYLPLTFFICLLFLIGVLLLHYLKGNSKTYKFCGKIVDNNNETHNLPKNIEFLISDPNSTMLRKETTNDMGEIKITLPNKKLLKDNWKFQCDTTIGVVSFKYNGTISFREDGLCRNFNLYYSQ